MPSAAGYSYSVRVIPPRNKKDLLVIDMHSMYTQHFQTLLELKNKLQESVANHVSQNLENKSQKRFPSACRDESSKTSRTRWECHHNTFTPSLHLVPFCQLFFVLVVCIGGLWKVVGRVLLCVVHVDVHGLCCVVGGCNVVATEHRRYSLSSMQKL